MAGPRTTAAVVRVDLGLYPLPVVHAAAWLFLERAYVFLAPAGPKAVDVRLRPKRGAAAADLGGEFGNELINQRQRALVARRNERLRDLIIGRALCGAQAADPSWSPGADDFGEDYQDDPMQIAIPWEERYGSAAPAAPAAAGPEPDPTEREPGSGKERP